MMHEQQRGRYPVVDAHCNLGRWLTGGDWAVPDVGAMHGLMDECGITSIVQPGDGLWGEELQPTWSATTTLTQDGSRLCEVDWAALEQRSPSAAADALAGSLRDSIAAGARGMKIHKARGLHVRDSTGALVPLDDE